MNSEKLIEIRNNLAMLPMLRERAEALRIKLKEAEDNVRVMLESYEKEKMDVENLRNNTLSATILKLLGKYEGKLEKESQEIIHAKIEYDKVSHRVKELRLELDEINDRIYTLKSEQRTYEAEIKRREQLITQGMDDAVSAQYRSIAEERERLERQLVEIQEAIRAGSRVKSTARSVMQHLDSADSWATYDVWFKGGIISHLAKYEHIDNAESDFNRLSSQLKDFKKELSDIDIPEVPGIEGIDSTTRALDFWFDNIFTDLRVRNQIRSNSDQIRKIYGNIDRAITKIENRKSEIHRMLEGLEYKKNELIISSQP